MKKIYSIAGMFAEGEDLPESFCSFETAPNADGRRDCEIQKSDAPVTPANEILHTYVHKNFTVQAVADGSWFYTAPPSQWTVQLRVSADYSRLVYFLGENTSRIKNQGQLTMLLHIALESRLIYSGVVSLHAACVEDSCSAIAFSGKSGIGKSTRAACCVEKLGMQWVSGDRPAIWLQSDVIIACGVPWDGQEQIFCNSERPLRAILEVRRGSFCGLRKLSVSQAKQFLVHQGFIPMWDTETAALALRNIRVLAEKTSVYRAFGGQEEASVAEIIRLLFDEKQIGKEEKDMKIREGFRLSNVVGEYIVLPTGDNIKQFDGAVVLNDVSAFVFEQLEKGICKDDLLQAILSEFDVEPAVAKQDLDELLKLFKEFDMLEYEMDEPCGSF